MRVSHMQGEASQPPCQSPYSEWGPWSVYPTAAAYASHAGIAVILQCQEKTGAEGLEAAEHDMDFWQREMSWTARSDWYLLHLHTA